MRNRDFLRKNICVSRNGFTLLEVIVAIAILGIAVSVVLQLFSANLRAISTSADYVAAASRAEAEMRNVLDDKNLQEASFSETTPEGYRLDVSVSEAMKERTENLQMKMLQIDLTVHWMNGSRERSLTLNTMKLVSKQAGEQS